MTRTEQVEIYRKQAKEYLESLPSSLDDWHAGDIVDAYVSAKLNQPIIELPILATDTMGYEFYEGSVRDAITAAGYQYLLRE